MSTWSERAAKQERVAEQAPAPAREAAGRPAKSAFAFAFLAWFVTFALAMLLLPDQVPIHWSGISDVDGLSRADSWTSKGGALTIMALAFLSIAPMVLLSRLVLKAPYLINVSNKDWWLASGERLVRLERLLREDLLLLISATIILLTAVTLQIIVASRVPEGASPGWVFWALLAAYLAAIGVVVARMMTGPRYEPYEDGPRDH